jgi:lambda repressor-like predicted transcriptional regulator
VEVIALLAKQDLGPSLEATITRRDEDRVHSHPVRQLQKQHRLSPDEVRELAKQYKAGATARELSQAFGVHRTTVLVHLERHGIERRSCARRLTDVDVANAAHLYKGGQSLKTTAAHFGVNAETLRREFKKADVPVRPRQGWIEVESS